MISFWVTIFLISFYFFGLYIFKKWLNPIFIYVLSWAVTLYLFDWQLMDFITISSFTWVAIFFAFFSFLLGSCIIYLARSNFYNNSKDIKEKVYFDEPWSLDKLKLLKRMIIVTAIIGLLVSLQHWYVLIKEFGSIAMVLLSGNDIYSMRVEGEHLGKIPYFSLLSFVSVFLSAIYSAYRNKFTFLVLLPLLAVILADAASLARAGIFFAFVLFVITFFTARFYFKSKFVTKKYSNNKNLIITSALLVLLALGSVSVIRQIRNPLGELQWASASLTLKELSNQGIVSSSMYLYFSSPIAVLSRYLDNRDEVAVFGQNTFHPIYNNLNRFGADVDLQPYPRGYFIPMWVNSATYIRELDVDFGMLGILFVPFIIGSLSTYFWYNFFKKGRLIYLTMYSFTTILIVFSIFYIGTRLPFWFFGFLFSIIVILYFDKQKNIRIEKSE